jgi:hypothetical protein
VAAGKWIRAKGSDVAAGQQVLAAGELLSAAELGLLATVGATVVKVRGIPRGLCLGVAIPKHDMCCCTLFMRHAPPVFPIPASDSGTCVLL